MTLLWPPTTIPPPLHERCVHVWAWDFACSPEQLAQFTTVLSVEERQSVWNFRFKRDQVRYAVCHGNLRHILGSYLKMPPSQLQFEENDYGKPRLAHLRSHSRMNFNLSHTTDVAILGIARSMQIGVDVEQIRPIEADVAEQYFSSRERVDLDGLTGPSWLEGFYNCWTRKEAILKAEGLGLNVHLDAFDVSLLPGALPELIEHRAHAGIKTNWILSSLKPSHDAVGAVATEHAPAELHCLRLADTHFT